MLYWVKQIGVGIMATNEGGKRNKPRGTTIRAYKGTSVKRTGSGPSKPKAVSGRFLKKGAGEHFVISTRNPSESVVHPRGKPRPASSKYPQATRHLSREELIREFYLPSEGTEQDAATMSAFDINSVQVVEVGGESVIQMAKEQFAALLEEMEVLEDSLAALRARADKEPRIGLDEYLKQRGARVRGDAHESGN